MSSGGPWVHNWFLTGFLRLAVGAFGLKHGLVVTFSVAGDLNGKELNPGG